LLRLDGWPWDGKTCREAAREGHFEALRWTHANGCPWDKHTFAMAADGGHLEVLQ
jgi:hypothetical protein